MTNNTQINWQDAEVCPVHNGTIKAEYEFGSKSQPAATLATYKGCSCCTVIAHDPFLMGETTATYHTSYDNAKSKALYLKALHSRATRW